MLPAWQASADDTTKPAQNCSKIFKLLHLFTIFGDAMQKNIQISTNKPSIGFVVHGIRFEMMIMHGKKT